MVCDRCKLTASEIVARLEIPCKNIALGELTLERQLDKEELESLKNEFSKVGFEVIDDRNLQIVNKIKSLIIEEVYESDLDQDKNISEVLAEKLLHDYSFLSSLFKKYEAMSIEKFRSDLKIERTKELLEYGELNINEIATKIGYKSVSYFCSKFKKETGFTPLAYQKKQIKARVGINSL